MQHIAILLCLILCLTGCVSKQVPPNDDQSETPVQIPKPLASPTTVPNPEFSIGVTNTPDAPFVRMYFDESVSVDMDLDSKYETIRVFENMDGIVTIAYTDGEVQKQKRIEPLYIQQCFIDDIVKGDGYLELFVIGDMASDDYVTYVYRIKDGVMEECTIYGTVEETDGIGSLLVKVTIDVFGTYGAHCYYSLSDKFDFEVSSLYKVIQWDEERKITVKKNNLSAQSSINGKDYEDVLLPAGTELYLKETDCKHFGLFKTDTDKIIRIAITKNPGEWGWYIDGIPEEEWFDGLSYSG